MKKRIFAFIGGLVVIGAMSFAIATTASTITSKAVRMENTACKHGQCQATAKSTENRCKHCVSKTGDKYCYQRK